MARVTQEDIKNFNELYIKLGTKAAVARETGFSASTVSKYIVPNYKPAAEIVVKRFDRDLPEFNHKKFRNKDSWNEFLLLSNEEKEEMEILWKEMSL